MITALEMRIKIEFYGGVFFTDLMVTCIPMLFFSCKSFTRIFPFVLLIHRPHSLRELRSKYVVVVV